VRRKCNGRIVKALHGLCASSALFHEKFANMLLAMDFSPCMADPNMWMKDCGMHHEHVCVCVDNLAIMTKDSSAFFAEPRNQSHA
jgi:hypothetical protein